jgi:sugar phosphate isomerase/epimerase
MLQIKVGIHLASLRTTLPKALALAAKLGADAVEIDARGPLKPTDLSQTALREVRKMLDDYRLRVCAVTYRTRRGYNELQDLDARVAGTKQAMQMAQSLGTAVVVNHVGHIPAEPKGPQWDLLLQVLTDLGSHGQRVGALLAAQTGHSDGTDLARLISALPEGSIGVDFDPGALVVGGFSAQAAIDQLSPHVLHVHASDGARDLSRGRGLDVPLGRGSVDYPAFLSVLEERGYRGYFTIERSASQNPELEIGQAVQFLRNL